MRIEKEKRKVSIFCTDGSCVRGFIYINPGIRVSDFINDTRENFIVMTNVEFFPGQAQIQAAGSASTLKSDTILLNKSTIKLIEEI